MKPRRPFPLTAGLYLPLYGKILLWFSLNLLLALALAIWFLRAHFGMDQGWLLSDTSRQRIQVLSTQLAAELRQNPREEWGGLLDQAGASHQIQLGLFEPGGAPIIPGEMELPDAVRDKLRPAGFPAGGGRRGGLGPREEHQRMGGERRGGRVSESFTPVASEYRKEALRTRDPTAYWFLVRLPGPERPPWILVGRSETLAGSGFFFDPQPWAWAALGLAGFSALLWLPFARGLTRSIHGMTVAAEEISHGTFTARVEDSRRDELGRLGKAINRMSIRLEGMVAGQKRFMGDIAHELCAPLARMEMGMGILEQRSSAEDRERLAGVREDVGEMRKLVGELLSFSKAGLGTEPLQPESVALAPLIRSVVDRETAVGDVSLRVSEELAVSAVPLLLNRALANLIRNALRHGHGTPVEIEAEPGSPFTIIRVADRGPGVPGEALPKIFDPFYRLDSSRSRDTGGSGLGLAIVKSCVEACGGSVTARNREGGGFAVEIHLKPAPIDEKRDPQGFTPKPDSE